MASKPVAKGKGSKTRTRQSSASAKQMRDASRSRGLMKDRISVLETDLRILRTLHEALLDEIRDMMQGGESLITHPRQL